jgi:hypothetical protein
VLFPPWLEVVELDEVPAGGADEERAHGAAPQYAPLVETRSGTVLDRMNRS